MASLMRLLNQLLPFATPGTPLIQDLIHLGVICVVLYFAPQIQEYFQRKNGGEGERHGAAPTVNGQNAPVGLEADVLDGQQREVDVEDEEVEEVDEAQANGGPDDADFEAFQRDQINEANGAGPADAANLPTQRNVGAKKAKSLAKRDQRRAHHEFQRAQGEAQRAKDAEGASEREVAQAAERERRKAVEAGLEARKAKEREKKRDQEKKDREEEQARREKAVGIVKRELQESRMCNVYDVMKEVGSAEVDEVWVERILNANGMLGKKEDGSLTMATRTGWIVRVSKEDMRRAYERAVEVGIGDENGKIGYEDFGGLLEEVLHAEPVVAH